MPAAVVFDMDGVLLDSEPVHYAVLRDLLSPLGIAWSPADHERTLGLTVEDTWRYLGARLPAVVPVDDITARYDEEIIDRYRTGVPPIPGARELVRRLHADGVPIAVASSSLRSWVDAGLDGSGVGECFAYSVAGDEVAAGKPDPEIYLRAARGIGVSPEACIALEDAPAGAASARAAGMRVALVGGGQAPDVDWRIDDLRGFDPAWLRDRAS